MNRYIKIFLAGSLILSGSVLIVYLLQFPGSLDTENLDNSTSSGIPIYKYRIVNIYPHDRGAFTQGLVYENNTLYEGTGRYGRSSLRKVDLETGNVISIQRLPYQFFGEGITTFGNRIIQLTWKSNVGFVYNKSDLTLLGEFYYPTEGWGITHNGEYLIVSDGTSTLHFLDPNNFKEVKRIEVFDNDGPVFMLNELEYIQNEVYANVWKTSFIARIDPHTGQVVAWIDLTGLPDREEVNDSVDVLNGIAYDAEKDRLFVTGKLWPELFEIEIVDPG